MNKVEFIYKEQPIFIACNLNEKMNDIFNKFITKANIDKNSIYFLYKGKKIDENLKLEELKGNQIDIKILVDTFVKWKKIINPKIIICPKCGENSRIQIDKYKIKLYECKNGHEINNILLDEFENIEKMDLTKIKCNVDNCEKNKGNTYNNEFYRCLKCKKNLCPLCRTTHDKKHDIIKYEQINYIFKIIMNIFISCSNVHKSHNAIYMFSYFSSISNLKEISKWNINNVTNVISMLPKWPSLSNYYMNNINSNDK